MKKFILFLFIVIPLVATSQSVDLRKIIWAQPVVANKVGDKFVTAYFQNINGLLGYRMNVNLEKRLLQIDSAILLSGFEKRPGSQVWIGEHIGKFLFSASNTFNYSHDVRLKQLMDALVKRYIACQLPDGYLGTYLPNDYWTEWDVWAHKYAIIGLLHYYSITGHQPALEAAQKAGDLICKTFGDQAGKRDIITAGFHAGMAPSSILEPMIDLYRYTADKKYLAFCEYILRAWERPNGPQIISRLEKYGAVTKVGNAKAYEMMSCFVGILKYYKLTGDEKYLHALQTAWTDIRTKRMYITGTSSDHEHFQQDGTLLAGNENHMGEGCVTTTWIQFNLQLLQITGEQKYVEELERSVYNHLLAAENPQTGCVSYYTALQGIKPYKCDQGFSCCLSSVPRGISLIPHMVWGKINNTFSVLLYEAGQVTDTIRADDNSSVILKIKSDTGFPLEGKVVYTITPSVSKVFALNFRVPDWSQNFMASIGKETYMGAADKFLKIKRKWKAGDKLLLSFEMPAQVIAGGISYPSKIAIKRGPQVLAIDAALNAGIDSLHSLVYKKDNMALADAVETLPLDWGWKQAYSLPLQINDKPRKVIMVPFAEAGQKATEIMVWIESQSQGK
jgi:uncharacterized protein